MKNQHKRTRSGARSLASMLPPPMLVTVHSHMFTVWDGRDFSQEWRTREYTQCAGDDTTLNELRVQERQSYQQVHQAPALVAALEKDRRRHWHQFRTAAYVQLRRPARAR